METKDNNYSNPLNIKEEMELKAIQYEKQRKQLEMCKKCCMATYTGNGWYCPLPYCEREDRYV